MSTNESQPVYCGSGVDDFHTSYKQWHGYVSLVVCILGTIANTLNIIVLSRREMRSPTNAILTGLAVADLAVMIEYIPYTIHDYILGESLPREQRLSYSWACFVKFHSIFAQVLHTISIWLTVTLAVWRYIAVGYPQKNRIWCGMRTTIITIVTAYVVCILIVSPSVYLISTIAEYRDTLDENGKTVQMVPLSQYVIDYNREMQLSQQQQQHLVHQQMQENHLKLQQEHIHTLTQAQAQAQALSQSKIQYVSSTASTWNATEFVPLSIAAISNHRKTYNNNIHNSKNHIGLDVNNAVNSGLANKNSNLFGTTMSTPTKASITFASVDDTSLMGLNETNASGIYRNVTVYRLYHSDLALRNKSLRNATFLIYSVLIKLIPCIALTILSVRLIAALLEAKRRRNLLTSNAANGMKVMVNGKAVERPRKNSKTLEKEKQTDRTTRMLLAVLLLFLITEFPQGIMGLLNTVLGDAFFMQCYLKLSDMMDILALINSSINFILYCSMSRQFRSTFTLLFRPKFLDKWLPIAQNEDGLVIGANGRLRGELGSKSVIGEQQFLTTQVTNV